MSDSHRTSASPGNNAGVEQGTPVGSPTPTGEPLSEDQPDLFPGARPATTPADGDAALLQAVGRLILAWGQLERTTADKVSTMRESFGDVRSVGGRTRPTLQKLLAELRALVAMRDRHDQDALAVIATIDGSLQRTAQFRQLIIDGAQGASGKILNCRDIKNCPLEIGLREVEREAASLDRICAQIAEI
ncbi:MULTISPECIES: hypothetical protein [unclassified Sphingobium]|uniref:hypothetical protein n=1 Tax=unclassified Sphingobium TaxID=2611147 RepID=UPI0022249FC9|nr:MULTISPECIES: hypothetical protein [unclassified Sphingobium]MCW2348917.1 hypothetical protein [Sphingobium sp. B12D2B]MCW2368044.1 hypothetical protein [Sphingobium sp. B11D3D]